MATSSIYRDVKIRDKHLGRSLATALENAKSVKTKSVTFQRTPQRVEKKDIKKFFGENDE